MTPVSVAGAVIDAYQIDVKIKTRDNYGPVTKAGIAAIDLTDDGVVFRVAAAICIRTPEPADRHDPSDNGDERYQLCQQYHAR